MLWCLMNWFVMARCYLLGYCAWKDANSGNILNLSSIGNTTLYAQYQADLWTVDIRYVICGDQNACFYDNQVINTSCMVGIHQWEYNNDKCFCASKWSESENKNTESVYFDQDRLTWKTKFRSATADDWNVVVYRYNAH